MDYPQAIEANDDTGTGTPGNPVTIDVLGNDTGDNPLDPTSVQIIDPVTGNPVTTLTVPGEGVWTVDPTTGAITFTPEASFTGDPTPITYTVDDTDGNTSPPATVTVDYPQAIEANDDTGTGTTGNPVTIDVLGNDTGDLPLDPTSVQIIDPVTGNPVTTLVVPGEGTWTVDPTTGAITFTPVHCSLTKLKTDDSKVISALSSCEPFLGNPTPIRYTVTDNQGNVSPQVTVTVIYPQAATPINVPTISSWMLIVLSMLLLVVGRRESMELQVARNM